MVVTFKEELTSAMRYEACKLSPMKTVTNGVENKGTTNTPGGDAAKIKIQ